MNISTFYSVSASIMAASVLNTKGSNLVKMAKSKTKAVLAEFVGNNHQVNQPIFEKFTSTMGIFATSHMCRCLSTTLITFTINNTFLGAQIKTITYVAGFFFIFLLPTVLIYFGYLVHEEILVSVQVLNVATLVASVAILPSMLSCSLTIGPGAFALAAVTTIAVGIDASALFKSIIS